MSEAPAASQWLRPALPSWRELLVGVPAWGALMGANAAAVLRHRLWEGPPLATVTLLFAVGGAAAFPLGLILARLAGAGRRFEARFAAALLALALTTVAVTAALFALGYRRYYAEWHADTFTITWAFQQVFTAVAALYQFAVLGVPLFFPLGAAGLLAAALWMARPR